MGSSGRAFSLFGYPYTLDPILVRGTDTNPVAANEGWYLRVHEGGTISKIGIEVGVASGNISVAAYRNSGTGLASVPGTRLATSGAVTCPAAGYAELSLGSSITVNPGDWFALSADNATATFRSVLNGAGTSSLGAGRVYVQGSAHPLPSTVGTLAARVGKNILMVGVV